MVCLVYRLHRNLTPLDEAQLDFSEEVRNGQKVSFKELLDKLNKNKKEN